MNINLSTIGLTISSSFLIFTDAHAYFDPGTGSLIIQALAGVGAFVALSWSNLKIFFTSKFSSKSPTSDFEADSQKANPGENSETN